MKLLDLDARFMADARNPVFHCEKQVERIEDADAVLFQCPKCAEGLERGEEDGRRFVRGAHYVRVSFADHHGRAAAGPDYDSNPRWTVSGTGLADLTLSPSVNLDVPGTTGCRWHGWVKNGEAK